MSDQKDVKKQYERKNFRRENKSGFLTIFFPWKCRFFMTFVQQNCSFFTWGRILELDISFESSWSSPLENKPFKWPTSGQQKVKSGLDCFFQSKKSARTRMNPQDHQRADQVLSNKYIKLFSGYFAFISRTVTWVNCLTSKTTILVHRSHEKKSSKIQTYFFF